jgi:hypothetical protein
MEFSTEEFALGLRCGGRRVIGHGAQENDAQRSKNSHMHVFELGWQFPEQHCESDVQNPWKPKHDAACAGVGTVIVCTAGATGNTPTPKLRIKSRRLVLAAVLAGAF